MDGDNRPLSEQYRIVAKKWVELDAAARLLEDTKTTVLEERKNALVAQNEKLADAHAERQAKADPEWRKWLEDMVAARTAANLAKVQLRYLEMRHSEQQSFEATQRAEMKL
jgi:hypothetical protein